MPQALPYITAVSGALSIGKVLGMFGSEKAAPAAAAPAVAPVAEMPVPDDQLVKRQALRAMQARRLAAGVYGRNEDTGTADTLG